MFKGIEKSQHSNLILNSVNLIVVSSDANGNINYISPATQKIVGYNIDELLGDKGWRLTYSSDGEIKSVKERIHKILNGNLELDTSPYDIKFRCKDGTYKWIEWRDSLGADNSYISVGVDITDWKRKEDLKLQSDSILNHIQSIILVSDINQNVIYASPSVEKITGYKVESLLGSKWWNALYSSTNDIVKIKKAIHEYGITGKLSVFKGLKKHKLKTKDGGYIWMEWQISKGINNTFIFIGIDITNRVLIELELKKAKEIAEQSLKAKIHFMANMSHEIRTPLNAVIGFTDLLLESELTSEQREHLETMKDSSEILLSLINNVLDLSKLETVNFGIEEIPFDLYKCINVVVKLMGLKAKEKGIALNLIIDPNIPKQVIGDPTRLRQILLNLIGNAIKFTNEGSVNVTLKQLEATSDTSNICIEIKDTGIGIISNKIDKIFGAFTQAKSDTSRIYGGTGLGLTIVKKLITLLKGSIEVESVFGAGSTFKINLPFRIDSDVVETEEKIQDFSMDEPLELSILLVEDNKTNQFLAKTRLERWKCTVDIANNGIEGVKKTQKKLYDIILMDIQMPIMDGYEATKIIKTEISEKASLIPIIAMTAYASSADINRAKNAGMIDYIYKPFRPDELYKLLKKHGKKDRNYKENEFIKPKVRPIVDSGKSYIDLKFLREETLNESAILKLLIELFIKDFEEFLDVMNKELKSENWVTLFEATHKIKPSISMFGISKMKPIIFSLETNFREEKGLNEVENKIDLCREIFKHVKTELLTEINS